MKHKVWKECTKTRKMNGCDTRAPGIQTEHGATPNHDRIVCARCKSACSLTLICMGHNRVLGGLEVSSCDRFGL